jgi:hypothetical protein
METNEGLPDQIGTCQTSVELNDEWRRWIAENLLLGGTPQTISAAMVKAGFKEIQATDAIREAVASPYLAGADRLKSRLAKREWLIETRRRLERLSTAGIERRRGLSAEDFFHDYYSAGRPVILSGLLENWPAMHKWNLRFLLDHYGEKDVEVQVNREQNPLYEQNKARHQKIMRFGDFLSWIDSGVSSNDMYLTASNSAHNRSALDGLMQDISGVPGYLDQGSADGKFLWIGPKGTVTPLHHDLTNNLLAQVVGRKRFVIASSSEIAHVYNLEHCFSAVDLRNIDLDAFPAMRNVRFIDFELGPGEAVFLPVGWWHFVESLDFSISISFTNFLWDNDYTANYPQRVML